jgi:hypothetical protein
MTASDEKRRQTAGPEREERAVTGADMSVSASIRRNSVWMPNSARSVLSGYASNLPR